MRKSLLIKFINGRTSSDEAAEVYSWIKQDERNLHYYTELRNFITFSMMPAARLDTEEADHDADKILHRFSIPGKKRLFRTVAAALVLFLTGAAVLILINKETLFGYSSGKIISASAAEIKSAVLPDGSRLVLNRGASVSYPDDFGIRSRKLTVSGEVWLDVVKNPQMPMFISFASGINIKVLGTRFLVNTSPVKGIFTAYLVSGKIEISLPSGSDYSSSQFVMLPEDYLTVDEKNHASITQLDNSSQLISWKNDYLSFCEKPLSEVLAKMSAYYNLTMDCEPELRDMKITINITDETPEEFRTLLVSSLGISVKVEDGSLFFCRE